MSAQDVLANLHNAKTKKRLGLALGVETEKVPTASVGLNVDLNGGFGYGRQTLMWGNKSASKSSSSLELIGRAQKQGKVCAWIDAERSYDAKWADRLGVDSASLIYSNASTINSAVDDGVDLMKAGVDILVVDSISALLGAVFFEKDGEEIKAVENTHQIGADARDMKQAVKMWGWANEKTALILLSQQRNKLGAMHVSHIPTGGEAVLFHSSTVVKLTSSDSDTFALKENVKTGSQTMERKVGRPVKYNVQFNKLGPQSGNGSYDFYYARDPIGIDNISEIADLAIQYGVVNKGGAWLKFEDNGNEYSLQGRDKLTKLLKDEPDIYQRLEKRLYEQI